VLDVHAFQAPAHEPPQSGSRLSIGQSLHRQIEGIGAEAGAEAIGVALYDQRHRTRWGYHADRWFHAASTIKIPVLLGVFDAIAQDELQSVSRVHVRNRFLSVADNRPFRVDASRDSNTEVQAAVGRTMRVSELARHMIVTSSNLATNLLIDIVGLANIRGTLDRLGVSGIELHRGVEDIAAFERDINNRVTADGLLDVLRMLEEGRHFPAKLTGEMLDILHAQQFKSGIPAGLPTEARVAHKTGEISTVAHDAGIVFLPDREPYVIAILTEWKPDSAGRSETIARISRAVYRYVTDGEDGP
jgi:beta-lactamase class A